MTEASNKSSKSKEDSNVLNGTYDGGGRSALVLA